jgi:hypothetical protein
LHRKAVDIFIRGNFAQDKILSQSKKIEQNYKWYTTIGQHDQK